MSTRVLAWLEVSYMMLHMMLIHDAIYAWHGCLRPDPLRRPRLLLQRGGGADEAQVPSASDQCLRGGEGGEGTPPPEHHSRTSRDERRTEQLEGLREG